MKPMTLTSGLGDGMMPDRTVLLRFDHPEPLIWPRVERHRVRSREGREYHLRIALPAGPAPREGFPAIYLLDANAAFGTMVEAVRLQSRRPATTGVEPAIVIGIGYGTDEPFDVERRTYDFTPSTAATFPVSGGADDFLAFLSEDLMPALERHFPVDPLRRLLFGHSLGGLFALHALFTRSELFAAVAAASPSLWWDEGSLVATENLFAARADRMPHDVRLMITVGSREQPPITVPLASSPPWHEDRGSKRMVDNARELAGRLAALRDPRLNVQFIEFADENHASVLPMAISRALRLLAAPSS